MPADADSIFSEALILSAEERLAFIASACGDDAALREAVEAKLAAAFEEECGADMGPTRVDPACQFKETAAGMIGPYKLITQIGEGGFGTVWMAEQQQPLRRRVALKILKAGMDTREVVARFEQERQALAMMDHPNIAQVFDGGCTETGRPYFVMELVRGVPVTRFCDEQKLGIRQRLELFADVCGAINHAHQKGIIHRDIKPSNVMVAMHGDRPVPKVIDFGIAKATQSRLTDITLFTRAEQFIGTPVYMSPEQAALSGLDIDTRSDIYGLGILLYELLTGRPPFDQQSLIAAGYEEMRRIIREVEPPRPSLRLNTVAGDERTTIAHARRAEPGKLGGLVEADLDWIVMKAIEKDRTRRYETASAFAADIKHFLADEPVSASPPGARYLLGKFARRHRTGLRVAAAMALLMVAGTITSVLLAVRAREAERQLARELDRVQAERNQKSQVLQFLTRMLQSPDPKYSERNITVTRVLDRAAQEIDHSFAGQPLLQAGQRSLIGSSYSALGDSVKAIPLQEAAYHFYRNSPDFGPEHEDTIQAQAALAFTIDFASTRRKEAIGMQRSVLAWYERHREAGHPEISQAMSMLGRMLHFDGEETEALVLLEEAARLSTLRPGRETPETMAMLHWLAVAYERSKDPALVEKAAALDEEHYRLCLKVLRADHPETIRARRAVASRIKDPVQRVTEHRELERLSTEVNGPDHPYTLCSTLFRLKAMRDAWSENAKQRPAGHGSATMEDWGDAALQELELLLPRMEQHCGRDHAETIWAMSELAGWLQQRAKARRKGGGASEAERDRLRALQLWQDAAALSGQTLGAEHYDTMGRKAMLAEAWDADGKPERAQALREELLPLYLRSEKFGPRDGATDWVRRGLIGNITTSLREKGLTPAERVLREDRKLGLISDSAGFWRATSPPENIDRQAAEKQYAMALHATGKYDEAAVIFKSLGLPPPRPLRRVAAVLIPPESEWRWFCTMDGKDPGFGARFAMPDFDDERWGTATGSELPGGEFGYTKSGSHIIDPPSEGARVTAYFRHQFHTDTPHSRLELRCRRDDGIIVYLDGKEMARDNMPESGDTGELSALAATADAECVLAFDGDCVLPPGPHVLAISLHNSGVESTDLFLGAVTLVEVAK